MLTAIVLSLSASGCQTLLGIEPPPTERIGPPGWVFYTTDVGGTIEIWGVPDTGGAPVRVSEGMTENNLEQLFSLTASWDGNRLAVATLRAADGSFTRNRHLWVVDVDGADPRHVIHALPDMWFYGLSWEGDDRHVVYAGGAPCADQIRRVDVDDPTDAEVVFAATNEIAQPMVAAGDRADILYVDNPGCSDAMTPRRLDLTGPTITEIPDLVASNSRYQRVRRSADGERFTYASRQTVFVHDFGTEVAVYVDPDAASVFDVPSFGNADTRLYAKWCSGSNQCDLVSIDPATGTKIHLDVADIRPDVETSPSVTWAATDRSIDADGDGIADGIDPSRKGLVGTLVTCQHTCHPGDLAIRSAEKP